ncbi:MAG: creatininase family protein [Methanomassiliicoccales archaeon]|nr:creatininase family protein [Methanomassiliicoccales archaeon]
MKRKPIIILPVGATEAHGAHLPLATDSLQPEAIADMLAERIGGLVAPPIRYGQHSSTRNMPGTLSIEFDTLRDIIYDILHSLVRNGADKLVVLSGHAGAAHMAALKLACERIVEESQVKLMLVADYELARESIPDEKEDGHGGLIETSRMLAVEEKMVKKARKKGRFSDKRHMVVSDPETCYPDGFVGDAPRATAGLGRTINDHILDRLVSLVDSNFGVSEWTRRRGRHSKR